MRQLNKINLLCKQVYRREWPDVPGIIRRSVNAALEREGIECGCEVNVLCTDDEGIKRLNADFRGNDSPTDVLSFPMLELNPGDKPSPQPEEIGERVELGDIAISLERAKVQAEEFGHGMTREVAYLTVHSVLHLLGYDHVDSDEQERQMNARADIIMQHLGISR